MRAGHHHTFIIVFLAQLKCAFLDHFYLHEQIVCSQQEVIRLPLNSRFKLPPQLSYLKVNHFQALCREEHTTLVIIGWLDCLLYSVFITDDFHFEN